MCYNNALESSDELRAKSSIIESHDKEGEFCVPQTSSANLLVFPESLWIKVAS